MSIKVQVWGPYALFTRPEMKVERVSYDVITPSAARGLLESIYWHPGLRYIIDRIWVLNDIRFTNLRRNELSSKAQRQQLLTAMNGKGPTPHIDRKEDIQQRAAMMLRDVHYVIEAHFEMTAEATPTDNPGKFQDIIKRRLKKGQCYSQPYFGCRECTADFRLWEGNEIPAVDESRDLGWMLYDMDYSDPADIQPMFFRAVMDRGMIDLRGQEVVK